MTVIAISQLLKKQQEPQSEELHCKHHHFVLPIDERNNALQVMRKLHLKGYEAYLVGGAVRDCLLGVSPKDFDVVSNATPEQVCQIFRDSKIVGKRFPIVHVIWRGERIEVTTFRSGLAEQNQHGRVVLDDNYGTIEQDVLRRDFTCNALYYDIENQEILDFHNGVQHIAEKRLVMIGEPQNRYLEDPVRILRAMRLANKLGFTLDEAAAQAISTHAHLLEHEPKARVLDEILKMLSSGHALSCLKQFDDLGIQSGHIHPLLTLWREQQHDKKVQEILQEADQMVANGQRPLSGLFLVALFWHGLQIKARYHIRQGAIHAQHVMSKVLPEYQTRLTSNGWRLPEPILQQFMAICQLQAALDYATPKTAMTTFQHPYFQAAYDWFLTRAAEGEVEFEKVQWWQLFCKMNATELPLENKRTDFFPKIMLPADCEALSRIVQSGNAMQCLHHEAQMCQSDETAPSLLHKLLEDENDVLLRGVLLESDKHMQEGRILPLSTLLAVVFWSFVQEKWQEYQESGKNVQQALLSANQYCCERLKKQWQISTDMMLIAREIWLLQHEFANMSGKSPFTLMAKPSFQAAFYLYRLRQQKGEVSLEHYTWWETFVSANSHVREKMAYGKQAKPVQENQHKKERPIKRKSKF